MQEQQTQAPPAPAPARMTPTDVLSMITDATVRKQYEQTITDRFMADSYGKGAGHEREDACTIIALGRDFGWGAAHSLQRLYMQGGKPRLFAEARAAMLAQAGYKWLPLVHDDKQCTYQFWKNGEQMLDAKGQPLTVSFTMADAERAGYIENSRGKATGDAKKDAERKGNYDKIPRNMLFARMITNFHRWHAAEVDGSTIADTGELLEQVVSRTESMIEAKSDEKLKELKMQMAALNGAEHANA